MKSGRVFFALLICAWPAFSIQAATPVEARVTPLCDRDYFPAVRREIRNAKESIVVTMYVFRVYPHSSPTSPTFILLRELLDAHRRGVRVRVILERSNWGNETARQMLSAGGVEARYAGGSSLLHQKLIVIDDDVSILGSANWSDSALKYNHEVSVLVRSKAFAKRMRDRISKIPIHAPEEDASGGYVRVPSRFLTDPDLVPAMVTDHDNRSFNLFLLLWREYAMRPEGRRGAIAVDYDVYAEKLGIDEKMDELAYRRQIIKVLRKLEKKYDLVAVTFKFGGPATVRIKLRRARGETGIAVPVEFWEYHLVRTLGLAEKMLYLISVVETETSRNKPWWSHSQERIGGKYYIDRWTVNQALRGLEREEILEVRRSSGVEAGGYELRRPNDYRLKPLMSPEDIHAEWAHLEGIHGKEKPAKARELAGRLDRPNSRDVAGTYLKLMAKYTMSQIEEATEYVARLAPDNPLRHIGTVINRLKQLE